MIQLLGGLGAGLAVVVVLLAWRLSAGPISLAFMTPSIESALNAPHRSFQVRLEDTILAWAGWDRALDIRVVNVRAIGSLGNVIAAIPELSLSISAKALLHGVIAPRSIDLFGLTLNVSNRVDGRFEIGLGEEESPSQSFLSELIVDLLATPNPEQAMSYLSRISIVGADLIIKDWRLERSWTFPATQISLMRGAEGIKGEVQLGLLSSGQEAEATVFGEYRTETERLDLDITFSHLIPAAVAGLSPELVPLDVLDVPLEGVLSMSMDLNGAVQGVGFSAFGQSGQIVLPEPFAQKLNVQAIELKGRYDGAAERLDITEAFLDLGAKGSLYFPKPTDQAVPLKSLHMQASYFVGEGRLDIDALEGDLYGPLIALGATIDGIGGEMKITAKGKVRDLKADELSLYWPKAWGKDAHDWCVENLSDGSFTEIDGVASLRIEAEGKLDIMALSGTMDLQGMTVDYLSPMPKVTNAHGKATFNRSRVDVFLAGGDVAGLTLQGGTVFMTSLDKKDQYADIDLLMGGPLQNALELIDHKPLVFATELGVVPTNTGGSAKARLKLNFMMEHALTLDRVKVAATADLRDVSIVDVLPGVAVRKGRLDLAVDKKGMDVTGKVRVGGIPATLDWRENFSGKSDFRSRYKLFARLKDVESMDDLGVHLGLVPGDFIKGSLDTNLQLSVFENDTSALLVSAALKGAALDFPAIGWRKEAGVDGVAALKMDLRAGQPTAIPMFLVEAADMEINGSVNFSEDGSGLERINFERVAYGRTDMSGSLHADSDGGWTAKISGSGFDLGPFIDEVLSGDADAQSKDRPRISIAMDLDKLWLGHQWPMKNVLGDFVQVDEKWRKMDLKGQVGEKKRFKVTIDQADGEKRSLSILAEDAGAMLRTLGYYENMVGGTLEVKGTFDDQAVDGPLDGRVMIRDYRVVNAPVLARVVSVMALTGIPEALQGDGLNFVLLEAPFTLAKGTIKVKDAKASGASLGFTASGDIYTHADMVNMEGTMVPAYLINSVLGEIPILGDIFTGGEEGGGVFAATYKMTGPVENPEISVNPLSALAPGFLRNLFTIFDSQEKLSEAPLPAAAEGASGQIPLMKN
jgi:hypothetical protein